MEIVLAVERIRKADVAINQNRSITNLISPATSGGGGINQP